MQRDYYASRQITLSDSLGELEQAAQRLNQAKQKCTPTSRKRYGTGCQSGCSDWASPGLPLV